MFFSWVDGDETVVVDTAVEFEDLIAVLDEDWYDDECELAGEMDVEIVEIAGVHVCVRVSSGITLLGFVGMRRMR